LRQLTGTAQPSLALEMFQEMESLCGPDREKTEKAAIDALGSMYTGS
jgi:hypothetical protein